MNPMDQRHSIPTVRSVDHFAFTVPDLDLAVDFFVDAFGAQELYRVHEERQPGDPWMTEHLGVDARAVADIAMLRLGPVTNIELFQYSSPGSTGAPPRTQDIGGHHLAFLVDDVDRAVEHFARREDVSVLGTPQTMGDEYPNAGDRWIYFTTSWGFYFEVHSLPATMPYETTTSSRRFGAGSQWTDGTGAVAAPVIPTATTVDHLGITVPDLDAAVDFFTTYLGAEHLYTLGPFALVQPFADEQLDVRATGHLRQALLRLGPTDNVELFQYDVDDQRTRTLRNSDPGASHIAFAVDDVDAAVEYLRDVPGVRVLGTPETIESGPIAGDRWVYFETPVGLSMEVLSMPDGNLPYEQVTTGRRVPASTTPWPGSSRR
jgi:catechol 2,3-dioxygenase-like lactoylglutathione lyase family enzyme